MRILSLLILFIAVPLHRAWPAQPPLWSPDPATFFTNVAGQLLRSELNVDLGRIQIYPTNQYTPALHRLLQVTANIYDCTTNRAISGYPYLPSVFRPIFRRDDAENVFITGYREVTDDTLANPSTAPITIEVGSTSITNVPNLGTAAGSDPDEPLIRGIPLIIGVRKGIPNFNELAMETGVFVSRYLEFRRNPALPPDASPVVETNQLYVLSISNAFGIEAWNSYTSTYPRMLSLYVEADLRCSISNETGALILTNGLLLTTNIVVAPNNWPGWLPPSIRGPSFVLPFGNNAVSTFLSRSSYANQPPWFVPANHVFERQSGFYVPRWLLVLGVSLRYSLVDSDTHRIIEYVDLSRSIGPVDVMTKLMEGANNCADYHNPFTAWCTNRLNNSTSTNAPTYGIMNQILVGISGNYNDWASYSQDSYTGNDKLHAVDFFAYNLFGYSPRLSQLPVYKTNVFYAPFSPYRPIYVHQSWQANDPLSHFTLNNLVDLAWSTNEVTFLPTALPDLGVLNRRFEPWGGSPSGSSNPLVPAYDPSFKDPNISGPENWSFPEDADLDPSWLGKVHRGTPWQTLFLKSTNFLQSGSRQWNTWRLWTGIADPWAALATAPTNDWRLVSVLAGMINTNDPHVLSSVNQTRSSDWACTLDGLTVLTNVSSTEYEQLTVSSNAPQTAVVANAIAGMRANRAFQIVGDILAIPELSMSSPWLNATSRSVSDESIEVLPAQLLSRLRADSVGSVTNLNGNTYLQFSGFDGYAYRVEASTDLTNWIAVFTNQPSSGVFMLPTALPEGVPSRFYRSVLLP